MISIPHDLSARVAARATTWLAALDDERRSDRGDVPGWVLITLMTAGLVVALWAVARDGLETVFRDAIDRVTSGVG